MQKLFGWFGGVGIKGTFEEMAVKKVPKFIAWLVIIGQSFGSTALIFGFLGRIAAGGLFIIFTGALIFHLPNGWTMNWFGKKMEKGLSITYCYWHCSWQSLLIRGSGALSFDLWLITKM